MDDLNRQGDGQQSPDSELSELGRGGRISESWFANERSLLQELRKSRVIEISSLAIPGYDISHELKRGGQGVVYLATQRSTQRKVAIKVLRDWTLSSADASMRFRREIDLAASLRHPHIVRVYDSGVMADGRAFLVMEFVEGLCLDEWAATIRTSVPDQQAHAWRAIAEMVVLIARAIAHAHQRGVIHRDIKPSNVRVDRERQPRVLDFGLARATQSDKDAKSLAQSMTSAGAFVGSLPWAAPEQIGGSLAGLALPDQAGASASSPQQTTRTDIYALGATLFTLLTGHEPIDTNQSLTSVLADIASSRRRTFKQFKTQLPEDLKIVVDKAMSPLPEDRYASASDLADDLQAVLAGQPIRAKRESAWRGIHRKARRYRVTLIAASCALIALGGITLWALHQRTEANTQRQLAQTALTRAETNLKFIIRALEAADPTNQGRDVRMADVLDRAASELRADKDLDHQSAASLHLTLGTVFRNLSLLEKAAEQFDLGTQRAVQSGDERAILDAQGTRLNFISSSLGRDEEIHTQYVQLLADRKRVYGPTHWTALESMNQLAFISRRLGKLDDAMAYAKELLVAATPADGTMTEEYIGALNTMAGVYNSMGKNEDELRYSKRAVDAAEKHYGKDHSQTLLLKANHGNTLIQLDRSDEAIPILTEVLESQQRMFGTDHYLVARTIDKLASAWQWAKAPVAEGQIPHKQRALGLFEQAIAMSDKSAGALLRESVVFRNNMAVCLTELGRKKEAAAAFSDAHKRAEEIFGSDSLVTLDLLANKGQLLASDGQLAEGRALLERAYVGISSRRGTDHPDSLWWAQRISAACEKMGDTQAQALWSARAAKAPTQGSSVPAPIPSPEPTSTPPTPK